MSDASRKNICEFLGFLRRLAAMALRLPPPLGRGLKMLASAGLLLLPPMPQLRFFDVRRLYDLGSLA